MLKIKNRGKTGVGYIYLPPDKQGDSRTRYVENCKRTGKVSIILEDGGGIAHNCPVAKHCIDDLEFPQEFGKIGSAVMFYIGMSNGLPYIHSVFNKENEGGSASENEYKVVKTNGNNIAQMSVDGQTGNIILSVNSDSTGGKLNINVKNTDREGQMNINVIGTSNISTTDKCSISSENEIELRTTINKINSSISIIGESITFNDNVLNSFIADINKLVDKLNTLEDDVNSLKQAFTNWTPAPMDGGAALKIATTTWYTDTLTSTTVDDIKDEKLKN
jgi:hypothetical protein